MWKLKMAKVGSCVLFLCLFDNRNLKPKLNLSGISILHDVTCAIRECNATSCRSGKVNSVGQ